MDENNKEIVFKEHNDYSEQNADMYTVVSIRTSKKILKELDEIQMKTNLSRNAIICKYIQYGLEHTKIIKCDPD